MTMTAGPIGIAAAALLAASCGAELATAQTTDRGDPPEAEEEMIVTGTRVPRTRALVPGSVVVVSGEDIDRRNPQGLNDVLRTIPGLHVEQQGARGGRASVFLRGLDPNHTVFLMDGVRLNDPSNNRGGSFDPTTLSALAIDRIEVVRGPASAIHGSDALAGAVQLVTERTPSDAPGSFWLQGSGGRFETGRLAGRVTRGLGFAGLSVAGSWATESDPFSEGGYEGTNLKGTLDAALPGELSLRTSLRYAGAQSEAFPEFSGGPLFAVDRGLEKRNVHELSTGFDLEHPTTDWLTLGLDASLAVRRERRSSPGIAAPPGDPFGGVPAEEGTDELIRPMGAVLATVTPFAGLSVTTGADVYWERGRSDAALDFGSFVQPAGFDLDRTVVGWFSEGGYAFPFGLALSASIRLDAPTGSDAQWTPRVGASFDIPKTPLALHASWGEGFKLPGFYSLGNPLVGNPALRPEQSRGYEVGLRARAFGGRAQLGVTWFDLRVDDLIDFDPMSFQLVNRERVRSRGIEVDAQVQWSPRIELYGHFTWNPTDIEDSQVELRNRPVWRGGVGLVAEPVDRLTLGLDLLVVGGFYDSSVPTGSSQLELAGYERLDFTLSFQASDEVRLFAAIDNLTDASYQEAIGFPAIGIRPRVGIEFRR